MSHYEITAWADFVRGVVDSDTEKAMQSHLDSGCRGCAEAIGALEQVVAVARAGLSSSPPEHTERIVRAVFSLRREWESDRFTRLPAEISFDSASEPRPVGTRSLQTGQRRVVYRSGEYALDLKVEREPDLDGLTLVGQLARGIEQPRPVENAQVFIMERERVVAQCSSNPFGEFQSRFRSRDALKLRLVLDTNESIEISVERPPLPDDNGQNRSTSGTSPTDNNDAGPAGHDLEEEVTR